MKVRVTGRVVVGIVSWCITAIMMRGSVEAFIVAFVNVGLLTYLARKP